MYIHKCPCFARMHCFGPIETKDPNALPLFQLLPPGPPGVYGVPALPAVVGADNRGSEHALGETSVKVSALNLETATHRAAHQVGPKALLELSVN